MRDRAPARRLDENVPIHLPRTIVRVASGVARRTSRLPSLPLLGERHRRHGREHQQAKHHLNQAGPDPPRVRRCFRRRDRPRRPTHTATAPRRQQAVVEPRVSPTRMIIHAEGRDRCHSRQRTGLPSSEGVGSVRVSRPRRPSRRTFSLPTLHLERGRAQSPDGQPGEED